MTVHCVFCGNALRWSEDASATCGSCHARFSVQFDGSGCVVGVRVVTCGADPCCQQDPPTGGRMRMSVALRRRRGGTKPQRGAR